MQSTKNGKVYVGATSKSPEIRVQQHNNGTNLWSKQNAPFILMYFKKYICWEDALLREKFYKMGFGKQIKGLILNQVKQFRGLAQLARAHALGA